MSTKFFSLKFLNGFQKRNKKRSIILLCAFEILIEISVKEILKQYKNIFLRFLVFLIETNKKQTRSSARTGIGILQDYNVLTSAGTMNLKKQKFKSFCFQEILLKNFLTYDCFQNKNIINN